jgi:quercetin dioxygenase-like cupin family protein
MTMATGSERTEPLVEDPVLKMRSRFWQTTEEGGQVLHVETWVEPGGGVTPHIHPAMEERFEVLGGLPEFLAGRRWKQVPVGDTAVVPPGTRHGFRNRGAQEAHFVCRATPPSTLQEFLEEAAALSRAGAINRRAMPTSLDALLRAAVMVNRHREMVTLLAPLPPAAIQRLVMPALARAGERRGYGGARAGH